MAKSVMWGFFFLVGIAASCVGAEDAPRAALLAVPDAGQQAKAEKTIRSIFGEEAAKKPAAERRALVERLLKGAGETKDDPALVYVLLRDARDLAAGIGDADTALGAVDAMGRTFAVNPWELKLEALKLVEKAQPAPDAAQLTRMALKLAHEATAAANYAAAAKLAAFAESAAKRSKDKTLTTEAQELASEIRRGEFATAALARNPQDKAANSTLGSITCFSRGDWARGLPMLAGGSDATLAALASAELKDPATAEAQFELANSWWTVAGSQPAVYRPAIQLHAATWYRKAIPGLKALSLALAEKRAALAGAAPEAPSATKGDSGRVVNLMRFFDVTRPAVAGAWKFEKGALVSDATNNARIQSSYHPTGEYDFLIEFTRPNGEKSGGNIVQVMSWGETAFVWSIASNGDNLRLEAVNGKAKKIKSVPASLHDSKRHTNIVQVRKDKITVILDGETELEYPTDYSELTASRAWKLADDHYLGLGTWGGPIYFHKVEVIEVGKGK